MDNLITLYCPICKHFYGKDVEMDNKDIIKMKYGRTSYIECSECGFQFPHWIRCKKIEPTDENQQEFLGRNKEGKYEITDDEYLKICRDGLSDTIEIYTPNMDIPIRIRLRIVYSSEEKKGKLIWIKFWGSS